MTVKTRTKKPKCFDCGKTIHRGGVYRGGKHFHKACYDRFAKQLRRMKWN